MHVLYVIIPPFLTFAATAYSTCTILQQENDDTVQAFLAEHPEFELVKTTTARKVKDNRHSPTLTILPSDFDSDGFFVSSLKKGI